MHTKFLLSLITFFLISTSIFAAEGDSPQKLYKLKDAAVITSIYTSFQVASVSSQKLDVELILPQTVVDNGNFVFGVKSEKKRKQLTIKIFTKDGFVVAHNSIEAAKQAVFRVVNLDSLPNGDYSYRICDGKGASVEGQINVTKEGIELE